LYAIKNSGTQVAVRYGMQRRDRMGRISICWMERWRMEIQRKLYIGGDQRAGKKDEMCM